MEDKINEAVDKAIANLNVDDLKVTKEQVEEIKKRLANDEKIKEKLEQPKGVTK